MNQENVKHLKANMILGPWFEVSFFALLSLCSHFSLGLDRKHWELIKSQDLGTTDCPVDQRSFHKTTDSLMKCLALCSQTSDKVCNVASFVSATSDCFGCGTIEVQGDASYIRKDPSYDFMVSGPMGVKDSQLSESSIHHHSIESSARRSRLYTTLSSDGVGCWQSADSDTGRFVQVDFEERRVIKGIVTQGRGGGDYVQYVTSYNIATSNDCITFTTILNSADKVFSGNSDTDSLVTNILDEPLFARCVRIHPITCFSYCCLRFDIIGTHVPAYQDFLVSGPKGVHDSQLSESSVLTSGPDHSAKRARLYTALSTEGIGAWLSNNGDLDPYVQVDFITPRYIKGIVTQGRGGGDFSQYVTSYKILTSSDCISFTTVKDLASTDKVFAGNSDTDTLVTNIFDEPLFARCVRTHPITCMSYCSLRFDVIGSNTPALYDFLVSGVTGVKDSQLSESSVHHDPADSSARRARLHTTTSSGGIGCWVKADSDSTPFVQVDFQGPRYIKGIVTQGRGDVLQQYVNSYKISTSSDCISFTTIKDMASTDKVFPGNTDNDSLVTNMLDEPVFARCVRILPVTWNSYCCMRFDVLGNTAPALYDFLLVSGPNRVQDSQLSESSHYISEPELDHSARRARLYTSLSAEGIGGWISSAGDANPYVQVDFLGQRYIMEVVTQGRGGGDFTQYVKSYKIATSNDCSTFMMIKNLDSTDKVFQGNSDTDTLVSNTLPEPVFTRCVRIHMGSCFASCTMRFDIIGI